MTWLILSFAPEDLRPWLLPLALFLLTGAGVGMIHERRRQQKGIPRLEREDKEALAARILLDCAARLVSLEPDRVRQLSRAAAWRCLRRGFRPIEEQWAFADVEVGDCRPVVHQGAQWTPEVSKVATGVMLTLRCSNAALLTDIACRVDDQHSMKHQSPRTGPLAHVEVRFKYPRDFEGAPALPSLGEWLEASWFQPRHEEEGVEDVGLGAEIATCRFRVVHTNPAIFRSDQA